MTDPACRRCRLQSCKTLERKLTNMGAGVGQRLNMSEQNGKPNYTCPELPGRGHCHSGFARPARFGGVDLHGGRCSARIPLECDICYRHWLLHLVICITRLLRALASASCDITHETGDTICYEHRHLDQCCLEVHGT